MTFGMRTPLRAPDTAVYGRVLRCQTCGHDVDLIEIPEPWIAADGYVCGLCMVDQASRPPLELVSAQNRDGVPY